MFIATILSLFALAGSAPVTGPDFNNIQYLHNISLTYQNGSLQGLNTIDGLSGVDSTMAQSLKDAINLALPGYLNSTSTGAPLNLMNSTSTSSSSQNLRNKRQAMNSTVSSTTTAAPSVTTSTQPYGTDEEFYARTDLVHFQVNIDDLEGSGN
ncbi:unnamed protein product [Caenorhabditis angaria]|uniref:Uncharacterized protein n=1 Tax=Caenorhabditis angaria TaxID=860376 RepID=A0A9P1IP09_9PELO|nr:unnamed protein product [Caenorhabditis angaria]